MQLLCEQLENYIAVNSAPEDDVLRELSRETHLKVQLPQMLSGNIQGKFLGMFSRLLQPKRILEIGTYTGYSAICMARGLATGGMLYTIDVNEELQPMCEKYFSKANLQNQIKHLIGDARQIIPTLNETFDLVFIDADKINYPVYYDLVFDKVRTGGYLIADNVLWDGKVVHEKQDKDTQAIVAYNAKVSADKRVTNFILPLRDGLNIAQKRV